MLFKAYPMIHPMIDPKDGRLADPNQSSEAVSFPLRSEYRKRVGHADGMVAIYRTKPLSHLWNISTPVALEPQAGAARVMLESLTHRRRRTEHLVKSSMIAACLTIGLAALGGCNNPADCSGGEYHGGCVPGAGGPSATSPAIASPVPVSPAAGSPAAVSPSVGRASAGTANVSRGDPSEFADVDDKQCRSYGLKFGSRDYADCRIRLSAQHRGVDPNLGVAAPGPGSR